MRLKHRARYKYMITGMFVLLALFWYCGGSAAAQTLAPFADFPWGAAPEQVEARHGRPAEKVQLPPDGVFWNYQRLV